MCGAGVGVAVIDSGIASWHDDLTNRTSTYYPYGNQRVAAFVDFVNGRTLPYDDEGHGISKLKNRLELYPLVAGFLDKYMK